MKNPYQATTEHTKTLKRTVKRFPTANSALKWAMLAKRWKVVDLRDGYLYGSWGWHPGTGVRVDC